MTSEAPNNSETESQPDVAKQEAKTPTQPPKVIEPVFSAEQNQSAKEKAKELGIFIQVDDQSNVTVLDSAKNRSWVEEYQLPELLTLDYLTHLTLEGPGISDEAADSIAKLPRLESLTLKNTLISNIGIEKLKGMSTLRIIDLRLSPLITDEAMTVLASMDSLKAVRLNGVSQLSNTGLESVMKLPSLVELDVRSCPNVTTEGIEKLVEKPSLRMLKVGGQSVDHTTLKILGEIKQLSGLAIQNSNITNAGLAELVKLNLNDVTVEQCSAITDDGLKFLEGYNRLKKLTLRDLRITGDALSHLSQPDNLMVLNVAQTRVNDESLKGLTKAVNLQELNLSETPVSDAAIESLSQLKNLKKLSVMQTKMTDEGIEKLKAALPDCEIREN